MLKEIDPCLVPSRLFLCLSYVARGVWCEGGKRGRESSSLFHSHHPLLPPRALREDEWDESELIQYLNWANPESHTVTHLILYSKKK